MNSLKLAAGAGLVLALLLAGSWVRGLMAERDEARAEIVTLEAKIAELAEANAALQAANNASIAAAAAQSVASIAALARRESLDEIMTCPAPPAAVQEKTPAAGPQPKGEPLNDTQDRKMVDYYNSLFGGLGGVRP